MGALINWLKETQASSLHLLHLVDMLVYQRLRRLLLGRVDHSDVLELSLDVIQLVGVHIDVVVFKVVHIVLTSLSILVNLEILIGDFIERQFLIIIQINEWVLWRLDHVADPAVVAIL